MKAQDVVVLLKLQAHPELRFIRDLATSLGYDVAGTHRSVRRLKASGLYDVPTAGAVPLGAAEEFLISAVKYFFPAVRGTEARGIPTSWAANPLAHPDGTAGELAPVWPCSDGPAEGRALEPLHPIVLSAIAGDEVLRRQLVLVDALRDRPSNRMRSEATKLLRTELRHRA